MLLGMGVKRRLALDLAPAARGKQAVHPENQGLVSADTRLLVEN